MEKNTVPWIIDNVNKIPDTSAINNKYKSKLVSRTFALIWNSLGLKTTDATTRNVYEKSIERWLVITHQINTDQGNVFMKRDKWSEYIKHFKHMYKK